MDLRRIHIQQCYRENILHNIISGMRIHRKHPRSSLLLPRKCPCDIPYKKGGNQKISYSWLPHTAAGIIFKNIIENAIFSNIILAYKQNHAFKKNLNTKPTNKKKHNKKRGCVGGPLNIIETEMVTETLAPMRPNNCCIIWTQRLKRKAKSQPGIWGTLFCVVIYTCIVQTRLFTVFSVSSFITIN